MATRGVGASNLAIGVHTAKQDSTPMVVLLGQVETPFLGREAFQEVDLPAYYSPITKWAARIHRAERIAEFVERGLRIATSGRPGPVMLALPADVLGEDIPAPEDRADAPSPRPVPNPEEVRWVARRIAEARRPVVIAGGGAGHAREELISFAEAYNVGVYSAFRRQDVFPNDHPLYLGHLTLGTPPETLRALEEAYLDSSSIPARFRTEDGIDPAQVIAALREVLPEEAVLTNDAGNFSGFLHRNWRYNHPKTQLAAANGAMGYGVPAAVVAKLAAPDRCVVACCGDGGFLMTGQEIETAVRYEAQILVVVFRNRMHGTIAMHQARELGRTAGTAIGDVDLAAYARSLGATGHTVRDPGDLVPAFEEALGSESVALVDVVTDPDIISPTARLSELAGGRPSFAAGGKTEDAE